MATLETQYQNYLKKHPESKLSFDEWQNQVLLKPIKKLVLNDNFVPHDIALKFVELGFDEECFKYYNDYGKNAINRYRLFTIVDYWAHTAFKAPLYQQLIEWLRINYSIYIQPYQLSDDDDSYPQLWCEINNDGTKIQIIKWFNTPKEAYIAAFRYILDNNLITQKNDK
jgi:hypothetical protein